MATFNVTGDVDPFLLVSMKRGERIYCESDAMVMMEQNLDLKGKMVGGFMNSMIRKLGQGESFFQQQIEAVRGDGDCLLSPVLPGAMQVLEVDPKQYYMVDGAFVACSSSVLMKPVTQGLGGMPAGTGGLMIMKTSGHGTVVGSGFGSMFITEVSRGNEITVDVGHVVAWDSTLSYEMSMITNSAGIGGLLSGFVSSMTTGEGLVLKFKGTGKLVVCSRNRDKYVQIMKAEIAGKKPGQ